LEFLRAGGTVFGDRLGVTRFNRSLLLSNLPVVIGMKTVRHSAEFMTEVLREVTERGDGIVHVGKRLGMADIIIYFWGRPARN